MKSSLKDLAATMKPPLAAAPVETEEAAAYQKAATRRATRQVSGHYPTEDVQAFRVLAAQQDLDVQELLAEAINMAFERFGVPNRIEIMSGRRKRD
jgi:hypothetical protein